MRGLMLFVITLFVYKWGYLWWQFYKENILKKYLTNFDMSVLSIIILTKLYLHFNWQPKIFFASLLVVALAIVIPKCIYISTKEKRSNS